ncbi:MAG: hypothetical protein RL693_989 [Verrucomicrobiota bacterium]|jgi:hypothetical protein
MKRRFAFLLLLCISPLHASIEGALDKLDAVGREGQGNEAASEAWKEVVKAGPAALLPLLSATGKGNVVADNWLRLAANVIADQAVKSKISLPLAEMEAFLKDTHRESSARQLAFDLIQQSDAAKADAIEPGLLNDPSQELRRGAVQRLIMAGASQVDQKQFDEAKLTYGKALDAARDEDQVKVIAEALTKQGSEVDLPKHFGFLMNWQLVGPFDNTKRAGFDMVFAPEKEFKPDTTYEGKGAQVKWQPFVSKHEYGKVDFNKPLGMLKETTAYAYTTFNSAEARDAEIRLGCKNAWKVWLNGELLFGRDEYHRGQQMDQYKLKCKLKKGANTILVKCCQNEQTETWTAEWEFQLRVCDATGTAIKEG